MSPPWWQSPTSPPKAAGMPFDRCRLHVPFLIQSCSSRPYPGEEPEHRLAELGHRAEAVAGVLLQAALDQPVHVAGQAGVAMGDQGDDRRRLGVGMQAVKRVE